MDWQRKGMWMTIGSLMVVIVTLTMAIGRSMDTRAAPQTTWAPTSIITGTRPMAVPTSILVPHLYMIIVGANLRTEMAATA